MARTIRRYVRGTIAGYIWQPGIGVCSKNVSAEIGPSDSRKYYGGPHLDLRSALLHLTNDGDFRYAGFIPGETYITVEITDETPGGTVRTRRRTREIKFRCPATEDLVAPDHVVDEYYASSEFVA